MLEIHLVELVDQESLIIFQEVQEDTPVVVEAVVGLVMVVEHQEEMVDQAVEELDQEQMVLLLHVDLDNFQLGLVLQIQDLVVEVEVVMQVDLEDLQEVDQVDQELQSLDQIHILLHQVHVHLLTHQTVVRQLILQLLKHQLI